MRFLHHHDDVINGSIFRVTDPLCGEFTGHRWPVNSPHKGQQRGALMFSFICAWINGWVNNREAGDLRRHRAHYDVTVMMTYCICRERSVAIMAFFMVIITLAYSSELMLEKILWPCKTEIMVTSSNGNICRITGHLWGEFTGNRWIPLTKACDEAFDLRLDQHLSRRRWFEMPSRALWRHCNDV